jgi:uncharacterized protein YfaS (alpha-2-macroglobulin family)/outer membrane protein assembly factor BamD (BamD/ComL family)
MFASRIALSLLASFGLITAAFSPAAFSQQTAEENGQVALVTTLPQIPAPVHQAMQSRDFSHATRLIDEALAQTDQDEKDYLQYLKGIALTEADRLDDALAAFEQLAKDYPDSQWQSRAQFGRAHILVIRRQYIGAGEIYRKEAERLLSRKRKDELAGIYLEFADRYYEGVPADDPSKAKKPDYKQALTYYQEAVKLRPTTELLQKLRFRIARCLEETDSGAETIAAYRSLLNDYGQQDPRSGSSVSVDVEAEARFRLGAAELSAGQPTGARRTWHDLLTWAGKFQGDRPAALDEFTARAEYRIAHTYGLPSPATIADLELGVAMAERFVSDHPDHLLAPQAELEIAQGFAHHGRHQSAVARLKMMIDNPEYENCEQLPIARRMMGQAYFSQQRFDDAIESWSEFLDQHPTDPQWPTVQQRIVNAEYAKAEDARVRKQYQLARNVWQTFLNKYPLDRRAPAILYLFGHMNNAEAVEKHVARIKTALDRGDSPQSVDVNDECEKLFVEAIADWRRLVRKYPATDEASQASYMIGVTLEDRLGRLTEALEAYRAVKGNREQQAQQRISRLISPQLEIVTERKFRSDEKPRIKLTTRNLEEVTIKTYRVDMTDYFRKMHLASGIETLDIALIDPDSQLTHAVKDFRQYQRIDGDVELPIEDVGVTAVTVSSEKLEVTTMVVVSDLDVIVKSSRNELFVFAEDMRSGKPIEGASILISDGSDVFAEELTNQDGVLQKDFDELKSVSDLRVFAVHQGHVASTINSLNGLDFAVGLTPRGYLYTDRPAYRAGQLVNIKGIVRWVDQDRFTFEPGEVFKLDVYDARGRQIQSSEVALNGYGTINSNLILPESSPQGDYRVHLHRAAGGATDSTGPLSFETRFTVTEYRLEPIQINVDLDKGVYFRGDKVEGSIGLKYYYGTPLAGETIQYTLGTDGETVTATTDDDGMVKVSLDTLRFDESQALTLNVHYPTRGISSSHTVFLATRGFAIGVDSPREVYISGETFDASFKVTDPAGKPVPTKLKVEVFRQVNVDGQPSETLLNTHEVSTDPETGEARQTLMIEEGGMYLVRASGSDQFDNQVSGQKRVRISGDKDNVRLRILAEKHAFLVGETAHLRVHWREQPALALVTFEGVSVLGYRLVNLKQGDNTITIPLNADLAPNFYLSVAVMERNRFHAASSGFRVTQRLRVTLKTAHNSLRPGEDLDVAIEVTDPQGNPVKSEISLALVQSNLLNAFGDVQGAIDAFFGAGERRPSVRQMTSCTFAYRPATRAVSQFLLADAERRETLQREIRALADAQIELVPERGSIAISGSMRDVEYAGRILEELAVSDESISQHTIPLWESNSDGLSDLFGSLGGEEMESIANAVAGGRIDGIVAEDLGWHTAGEPLPMAGVDFDVDFDVPTDQGAFGSGQQQMQRLLERGGQAGGRRSSGQQLRMVAPGQSSRPMAGSQVIPRLSREQGQAYYDMRFGDAVASFDLSDRGLDSRGQSVWFEQLEKRDSTVNALTGTGKFLAINGRGEDELRRLAGDEGLQVMPTMAHAETAFWDPVVVTDDTGQATVVITMPTRSTAWRLQAKGIDKTSLAGEASVDVITKKELFGDLKLPPAFTDGDKAAVPVQIHNSLEGARQIEVVLTVTLADRSTTQAKRFDVDGPGITDVDFPVEIAAAEMAGFQLTVSSGDQPSDESNRNVPIVPYGYPVYETSSGRASQSTIAMIGFDEDVQAQNPSLEILIGSSINRSLIESVIGGGMFPIERCGLLPSSGLERNVSDVLGGVALLKMIGDARQSDTPEGQALATRITAAVTGLVSAQRDDGSWSWSGRTDHGNPDVYLSSRVMWALSAARASGFSVAGESFDKGKSFLKSSFAGTAAVDLERQTILLHAMAESRCADFALANRLYRERNRLSNSGLVHLALGLSKMNHSEMAGELLSLVKIASDPQSAGKRSSQRADGVIPWMQSGIELRALYLLAIQQVRPAAAEATQLADWLLAARVGSRWPVEKSNGPTIAALADWQAATRHVSEKYQLTIFVNDEQVDQFTVEPSKDASRRVAVPRELLSREQPGGVLTRGNRIRFDLEGRGTFSYSAILTGFVAADQLRSTTESWTLQRRYEPAQQMFKGRVVPRGFGVVDGPYRSFHNPLTELPVGGRGEVTLSPRRRSTTGQPGEQYDYLVLSEPIPAGCTVLDGSVTGPFERYEVSPGKITFYVGAPRYPGDIRYTLVGYVPGSFRTAQSLLRSFYDPSQMAIADAKSLTVLPSTEQSSDEYRLTPDELYHLGQREIASKNYQAAHRHLTQLMENWRLDAAEYKSAVQWLLRASMELKSHGEIVKYFEVIKEKFPAIELSFEDILQVALSYRELGEYERSYLVYRSTVEASFQRESQVAGFLNARGEFIRSVNVMERLLSDYPAESYIATATYALAQEVYRRAPEAADDPRLAEQELNRIHLINASIQMLDHFVSTWPTDPADDQASFALATALIDLDQYESAIARCHQYALRYPNSRLLDSFWYMTGYSHFELEHHQQALEMCEKVATASFPVAETGGTRAADNKWEAVYIMGQVYHSLGQAADAIIQYTEVKQRFVDAAEAIEFFTHKEIRLDEVTTIKPNDPKQLELKYRNISDVAIKVYRIDLMKFGLMQRNLDRITAINLAGIKPYHEETIALGDGNDYRDRTKQIDIPLDEEGAYLVVCRGENLYASGLVLVSPLALSVSEDATSGRVRVSVKNSITDAFVDDVHVKVIGSANDQFRSGPTDLRGLFVGDDIRGTSTVIAQVDHDQYAFYRGEIPLQGVLPAIDANENLAEPAAQANVSKPAAKAGKDVLRGQIYNTNGFFQMQQKGNFDGLLNNERKGIATEEAY